MGVRQSGARVLWAGVRPPVPGRPGRGTRSPRGGAAAAGVVCLLALTGCSGSSGSSGSSASPSSPAGSASATSGSSATPSASSSAAATGGANRIEIKNFAFHPASLTVKPGASVTVTNDDQTAHTVTATGSKDFDTGDIAPGKSTTFTAPKATGSHSYICTIHPFMKGTLTVG
jgi:plastocyanin